MTKGFPRRPRDTARAGYVIAARCVDKRRAVIAGAAGECHSAPPHLATAIRERKRVENGWIAHRLAMGSPISVSRLVSAERKSKKTLDEMNRLLQTIDQQ